MELQKPTASTARLFDVGLGPMPICIGSHPAHNFVNRIGYWIHAATQKEDEEVVEISVVSYLCPTGITSPCI
jgi:hypothetical protein